MTLHGSDICNDDDVVAVDWFEEFVGGTPYDLYDSINRDFGDGLGLDSKPALVRSLLGRLDLYAGMEVCDDNPWWTEKVTLLDTIIRANGIDPEVVKEGFFRELRNAQNVVAAAIYGGGF